MSYYWWPFVSSLQQLLHDMTFSAYLSVSDARMMQSYKCGCWGRNDQFKGTVPNPGFDTGALEYIFEQCILLEGYSDLLQWFSDTLLWHFWHASEVSDITVYHHIIGVSDKTSVNFKGTNLRLECLGELLYWFSILLFTLEGSCTKTPNKPCQTRQKKMKQNETKPEQTKPNWTKPNQTRPNRSQQTNKFNFYFSALIHLHRN